MIPVLGVPVLNRYDLLGAMERSIDHPVGRYYVLDNGGGYDEAEPMPARHVCRPGANLGVAASWNLIIRANVAAPWWLLAGADTTFAPGDLARLAEWMDGQDGPACGMLLEFGAFAVNAAAIETVGWFDEHFHPIYAEDTDWKHRARLRGVPVVALPSGTRHAEGGSVSIREPGTDNGRTYPRNVAYSIAKWGGPPHAEVWTSPFGLGDDPDIVEMPPLARLRELAW